MSTFDHAGLIQGINENLATFRKAQPDTMRGFAQLAQASMAEGALSSKHKELIALAIGVTLISKVFYMGQLITRGGRFLKGMAGVSILLDVIMAALLATWMWAEHGA